MLPSGRVAPALGDAWVVNDPLTGQGADLGPRCAFESAELIVAGGPFDAGFAERAAERLWRVAEPVVARSSLGIGPPPEHLGGIFAAAIADPRVADAFVTGFNRPAAMWEAIKSPEAAQSWLRDVRPPAPVARRIDWILTTPGVTVHRAAINTFSVDGRLPSDHLPVQASLPLGALH